MAKYEAGFIGAGNMGGALALAAAKKTGGDRIAVACSTRERSEAAAQRLGCTAETPQRILSDSRFVFLGVKPQMVVGVVEGLKADILASEGIFVSMLAGVSLEKLALLLGADKKIIRIMPNTPCAVGQGLILYAANGRVSEDELCAFRELMAPAGLLDELNEHLIDAASAVSGCGPAYAYLFIEALADGGVKNGLPRAKAQRYAAQMLLGSAEMVLRTGRHPGQLKDEVCSPGGSTIAGVAALERSGLRSACIEAVDAAVWHLAGLVRGDLPNELIPYAAKHAQVAIDVQCMLRCVENGGMVYHDWAEKKELLPYVRFLKTDAAEAEILTGLTDRAEAAKLLYSWGAKEIMITHNSEVLVYDGREIYTCPIRSRNLSGRTGRGDTTFAGYINERLTKDIPTALQTATALVSLKMETPGPFTGTRQDVEDYIKLMY